MEVIFLEAGAPASCYPLTCERDLGAFPMTGQNLLSRQQQRLEGQGLTLTESPGEGLKLYVRGDAWLSEKALQLLKETDRATQMEDLFGDVIAWTSETVECPHFADHLNADTQSFKIRYPWDLLRVHEEVLQDLQEANLGAEVHPGATLIGPVELGKNTRVLPGAYIEGPVRIGENCRIGPNCYIRGRTTIGDNSVVGNAVEIKNSLILNGVNICHLSYVGDSIVGEEANLGAGTITANFRHDGRNHRSQVFGDLVDTGRTKLGAIIGDHAHLGIHTSIYPGRKIWPHKWTRPGAVVQYDVKS